MIPVIFDHWTINTIPYVVALVFGYAGLEKRIYALQLLKQFHCWYQVYRSDSYVPPHQQHHMLTRAQIALIIQLGQEFDESQITTTTTTTTTTADTHNRHQAITHMHAFWEQIGESKPLRWWSWFF